MNGTTPNTVHARITRIPKKWQIESWIIWDDGKDHGHTFQSTPNLVWAIYEGVKALWEWKEINLEWGSLTVNRETWTPVQAWNILEHWKIYYQLPEMKSKLLPSLTQGGK